jgi:thioredoxin reductase (NADPH)
MRVSSRALCSTWTAASAPDRLRATAGIGCLAHRAGNIQETILANDLYEKRREQMFPKLTARQIARLEAYGERSDTHAGQVLAHPGERDHKLLVVLSGSLEVALPGTRGEAVLTELLPGDFAGEMSALRGVAGFSRIRVREPGAVLAIGTDSLRNLVQTDAELSEILMRAFILRRMGLVSSGQSEAMLLGSRHSPATLRLKEFLTRNNYPYVSIDVDNDTGVQALFERFRVSSDDIPVMIGRCGRVFRNPDIGEIAEFLQMNPTLDETAIHDLAVVGAGPAGLAAAVYAASEGLDVLVVESTAPGGQAGTSSRIENYLGFPTGISGQALAGRAFVQAQKFGANLNVACRVTRLNCERRPYALELSDGRVVRASTVVIASGAQYRAPQVENLQRFIGAGVYYAATHLEARLCEGEEIAIVGGGNSAGQAAVFLAASCRHVHLLIRSAGLNESMSRYLIRRIEENPNITLHTHTQLIALQGDGQLENTVWRSTSTGEVEQCDIKHLFLMTGAVPNTDWLRGCVSLDPKGFVKTGADLSAEDLAASSWALPRAPFLLETSLPGVFAVGDVRCGSVKRIASAVGEGSICVQFVHRALPELSVETQRMSPGPAARAEAVRQPSREAPAPI